MIYRNQLKPKINRSEVHELTDELKIAFVFMPLCRAENTTLFHQKSKIFQQAFQGTLFSSMNEVIFVHNLRTVATVMIA